MATLPTGTAELAQNRSDWTSEDGESLIGSYGAIDNEWTACAGRACGEASLPYCVENG